MVAVPIPSPAARQPLKTLVPEVLPPTRAQLARMDEADRDLIGKLLSNPFEYIEHELFEREDAQTVLFGGQAVLAPGTTYFEEPAPVEPAADEDAEDATEKRRTLTSAEESLLFHRFNYARMQVGRLFDAYRGRRLPFGKWRELLAWAHRVMMARGQIVQANLGLVRTMARQPGLATRDYEDLIAEGNLTLLRSIDRFDCSRGYKFSTYACRALIRSCRRTCDKAHRYRRRFPIEFDQSLERGNFIEHKREEQKGFCVDVLRGIVNQNRASLDDIERWVLQERFCLGSREAAGPGKTLTQLGSMLGVTRARVRQIQNTALRKLRRELERDLQAA